MWSLPFLLKAKAEAQNKMPCNLWIFPKHQVAQVISSRNDTGQAKFLVPGIQRQQNKWMATSCWGSCFVACGSVVFWFLSSHCMTTTPLTLNWIYILRIHVNSRESLLEEVVSWITAATGAIEMFSWSIEDAKQGATLLANSRIPTNKRWSKSWWSMYSLDAVTDTTPDLCTHGSWAPLVKLCRVAEQRVTLTVNSCLGLPAAQNWNGSLDVLETKEKKSIPT